MKLIQEQIVDFILHGPETLNNVGDDFDELMENYMETFACDMSDDDADLAYGFSDWLSDIYYDCWSPHCQVKVVEHNEYSKNGNVTDYPSLTNITTKRAKRNFSEEEDLEILKFLIRNRKFAEAKDDRLWSLMENNNVIHRRSAHSMKERFKKKISPSLTLKLLCSIYAESL